MTEFIRDHVPAKFKDRAPRVVRRDDGSDAWLIEGQGIRTFGLNAVAGRPKEDWGSEPYTLAHVRPGTYDAHARGRDMAATRLLVRLHVSSWPRVCGELFLTNI